MSNDLIIKHDVYGTIKITLSEFELYNLDKSSLEIDPDIIVLDLEIQVNYINSYNKICFKFLLPFYINNKYCVIWAIVDKINDNPYNIKFLSPTKDLSGADESYLCQDSILISNILKLYEMHLPKLKEHYINFYKNAALNDVELGVKYINNKITKYNIWLEKFTNVKNDLNKI